jgi:EpsI family protein
MSSDSRRFLLVIGLLVLAVALSWGLRFRTQARPAPAQPTADAASTAAPLNTYFVDVDGWYRITPYETAVLSPLDLTAESSEAMAQALPAQLGPWTQSGPDEFLADDPDVIYYLNHPTVALQRTYQDAEGHAVTLALIGNRGQDSFLLFSHTPETCYPGQLWNVVEKRQESALLDDQPMYAQYLLTQHAQTGRRLMVLFWYLWDDPRRDSEQGVLSMRVNVHLAADETPEQALARAWEFIRALFPATLPWQRF